MTGEDFRRSIEQKWGRAYDVQLQRRGSRVLLLVMWKYLGQRSFPLTAEEYTQHLEAILERLADWGVLEFALQQLQATRQRPRLGKAVSIPLDLGERASEWLL
ncbi:DUF3067 family protein [Synechococcus sp. PCC 7336]|uniref:DUF3067 family protein n=1 Tax=Synechococcus sp. PCC 7336 TaxID=195250 RepID=UPI00034A0A62|nr:DUF3067 family protein [Synechococcus sp. PCC 7336]